MIRVHVFVLLLEGDRFKWTQSACRMSFLGMVISFSGIRKPGRTPATSGMDGVCVIVELDGVTKLLETPDTSRMGFFDMVV